MSHCRLRSTFLVALAAASLFSSTSSAENWSQFRGQNAGIIDGVRLPFEWSSDKHIVWKVALPGVGWSQPVVWGDKVFVTTAETDAKPNRLREHADRESAASPCSLARIRCRPKKATAGR